MGLVGATTVMGIWLMLYSCIPGQTLQGHEGSVAWTRQAGGMDSVLGSIPSGTAFVVGPQALKSPPPGHAQEGELPKDAN